MSNIGTLIIRARYALEPEEENFQDDLNDALEAVLGSIEHTLRGLGETERIGLIEEIEAFSIQERAPSRSHLELLVVNE